MPCTGLKCGTTVSCSAAPSPVRIGVISVINVRNHVTEMVNDLPKATHIRGGEARA